MKRILSLIIVIILTYSCNVDINVRIYNLLSEEIELGSATCYEDLRMAKMISYELRDNEFVYFKYFASKTHLYSFFYSKNQDMLYKTQYLFLPHGSLADSIRIQPFEGVKEFFNQEEIETVKEKEKFLIDYFSFTYRCDAEVLNIEPINLNLDSNVSKEKVIIFLPVTKDRLVLTFVKSSGKYTKITYSFND